MVRFGILGFGLHAVRRLMPGFALAKACQVTALSRRDLAKARASAAEFNVPLAFDSGAELCRSPEVDAVFVTTPNALHLQDVLTAVAAGKPVLCEKPMGLHAGECRQMVEAARAANVLLGVAQVFRFENSTARPRATWATPRFLRAPSSPTRQSITSARGSTIPSWRAADPSWMSASIAWMRSATSCRMKSTACLLWRSGTTVPDEWKPQPP